MLLSRRYRKHMYVWICMWYGMMHSVNSLSLSPPIPPHRREQVVSIERIDRHCPEADRPERDVASAGGKRIERMRVVRVVWAWI